MRIAYIGDAAGDLEERKASYLITPSAQLHVRT